MIPSQNELKTYTTMNMPKLFLLLYCVWISFPAPSICPPPPSPIKCTPSDSFCTVSNAYIWADRIPCNVSTVVYPSTEDDILHAVAAGVRTRHKMKVVSAFSHTIPKFVCPADGDGAGILITTKNYNNHIAIDKTAMTVTADSGVGLRNLIDTVAAAGFAVVAAPYWEGLSLGGILSTGSHGSSFWGHGGALHEYVVSIRLVVPASEQEGYSKVVTLNEGDTDLNAAKVSLGLLGVISKVGMRI